MLFNPLLGNFLLLWRQISCQNFLVFNGNRNLIFTIFCMDVRDNVILFECMNNKFNTFFRTNPPANFINCKHVVQELHNFLWGCKLHKTVIIHSV